MALIRIARETWPGPLSAKHHVQDPRPSGRTVQTSAESCAARAPVEEEGGRGAEEAQVAPLRALPFATPGSHRQLSPTGISDSSVSNALTPGHTSPIWRVCHISTRLRGSGPFRGPRDRMRDQTHVHTHTPGPPPLPGRARGPLLQPFPLQTRTADCRVLHAETLDPCPNYCCQMKDGLPVKAEFRTDNYVFSVMSQILIISCVSEA